MNDQGRSVTMRALMRALSGSACGCPCCETPRNRRCAVCACHPRRWCSHSGLSPTCLILHFMSRFSLLYNSFNSLFSRSHFSHMFFTVFSRHFRCSIYRRRIGGAVPRAENFGDLITADHKVLSDNCESRHNHRYAVEVQDLATQWIQSYPCKTKTSQETQRSLQKFLEPNRKPKVIYTDNSLEFGKACEDLSWNHCTSTPHRSETNGIAERAVHRVKEDTSAVLLQSGLDENWWADSMECNTYLPNIQDLLSDGRTPYERRFGKPFKGPIIPFGSLVEYYTISAKDQSRIHQFEKKVLPGLFLGYALYAGRNLEG